MNKLDREEFMRLFYAVAEQPMPKGRAYQFTRFTDAKHIVRFTRRRYKGKVHPCGPAEVLVTIGKPNYSERAWKKRNPNSSLTFKALK